MLKGKFCSGTKPGFRIYIYIYISLQYYSNHKMSASDMKLNQNHTSFNTHAFLKHDLNNKK